MEVFKSIIIINLNEDFIGRLAARLEIPQRFAVQLPERLEPQGIIGFL